MLWVPSSISFSLFLTYFLTASFSLICDSQDYVNNWRETALMLTSVLFLAAGIWFIGK